ncbi:uncharacterized protein LOC102352166 [Latimeria chalumnae]|uniref:uncharacterized protein LOC102352166 n=1 Tax=Latimeria chalumnae TaxID=7897 RepID=UPI0006D9276B|nr:PREDICTED: uncharacterized protein LOC102352166 isoform X2 [Latimeria chalumnae]|eukprot:XP_014340126.1 PREDICTED: uncharacterized protein LOC102352166 isoform X2 [Latimeria chalumnae]
MEAALVLQDVGFRRNQEPQLKCIVGKPAVGERENDSVATRKTMLDKNNPSVQDGKQAGKENQYKKAGEVKPQKGPLACSGSKLPLPVKSKVVPDFKKLHQSWQNNFQKGVAVSKKPCTQPCPFNITQKGTKFSALSSNDEKLVPPEKSLSKSSPDALHNGALTRTHQEKEIANTEPGNSFGLRGLELNCIDNRGYPGDASTVQTTLAKAASSHSTESITVEATVKQEVSCFVPRKGLELTGTSDENFPRTVQRQHGAEYCDATFEIPVSQDSLHCLEVGVEPDTFHIQHLLTTLRSLIDASAGSGFKEENLNGAGLVQGNAPKEPFPNPEVPGADKVASNGNAAGSEGDVGTGLAEPNLSNTAFLPEDQKVKERVCTSSGEETKDLGPQSSAAMNKSFSVKEESSTDQSQKAEGSVTVGRFEPDPRALATILSNKGVSTADVKMPGKFSLAQRVPVKGRMGNPSHPYASSLQMGSRASAYASLRSVTPGLELRHHSCIVSKLAMKDSGSPFTPSRVLQEEAACPSMYGSARRVPNTRPQSRMQSALKPRFPKIFQSPAAAQEVPSRLHLKWADVLSPLSQTNKNESPKMEKIAVQLFEDNDEGEALSDTSGAAVKTSWVSRVAGILSNLKRIEILTKRVQREMQEIGYPMLASDLKSCNDLYSVIFSEVRQALSNCTLLPESKDPSLHRLQAAAWPPQPTLPLASSRSTLVQTNPFPALLSKKSVSTAPSCAPLHLNAKLGSTMPSSGLQKCPPCPLRKLSHLKGIQSFQETQLDDECAFYTSRLATQSQNARRDLERNNLNPLLKILMGQETMHFVPIELLRETEGSEGLSDIGVDS